MTSNLHAGAYALQVSIIATSGYAFGTLVTPESPVNGTVYAPYAVPALVEYRPATQTTQVATSFANQKVRGRRTLGKNDLGIGTLVLSEFDSAFDALVMGYTQDVTTATGIQISAHNVLRGKPRRFLCGFTSGATPVDSTPNYATIFKNNIFFDRADEAINQGGGNNPNNVTYEMYINTALKQPWGKNYNGATVAVDGNADDEITLTTTAPVEVFTWVDDGSATTITAPYAPDYTEHAGVYNIIYKNGADNKANVSGISGSTITLTHGTAADIWEFIMPSLGLLSISG